MSWSRIAIVALIVMLPCSGVALTKNGFENLDTFSRVLHNIVEYHVDPPSESVLIQGAIRGLFESLDPHSAYLAPRLLRSLKTETEGRFGGVGIEVIPKGGWLTVVAPLDGSPAAKAGIKAGDRIVKVDGVSTKQISVGETVAKLRGRPGSTITLTILRHGSKSPFDVVLRRAIVQAPSVRAELTEPGYPYLRITSFREQTFRDLVAAVEKVSAQHPIQGLVLDLRNNPGGLLDQSVSVADLFLQKGVIVMTESRGKVVDKQEAHPEGTQPNYPIVILINGGSASAAEIVTGALQDHHRAVILGTQSFGKGSVQTVIEFDDRSALKLTIARYYTPSKRSIQAFGITPDIIVPEDRPGHGAEQNASREPAPERIAESQLPRHLKGRSRVARAHSGRWHVQIPDFPFSEGEDYQRAAALSLLKNGTISPLLHL